MQEIKNIKHMEKLLLMVSVFRLGTLVSQVQWQPDVLLTNDPALLKRIGYRMQVVSLQSEILYV